MFRVNLKEAFISVIAITALITTAGCGALKKKSDAKDSDGALAIVAPAQVKMGELFTLTVTNPGEVRSYAWSIVSAVDGGKVEACPNETAASITCTMQEAGAFTVLLEGRKSNSDDVKLSAELSVLDPSTPENQAPVIVMSLTGPNGEPLAAFATFKAEEQGSAIVERGKTVTFDFSQTTDDGVVGRRLKFERDIGQGWELVDAKSTAVFANAGLYPIKIRATDGNKNVTEKTFMIVVKCGADVPELAIVGSGITVTGGKGPNFFSYSYTGGITGGGGGSYQYMWDFNGDGIFDTNWLAEASVLDVYSVYMNSRNVRLTVWDTACNFFANDGKDYDFVNPAWVTANGVNTMGTYGASVYFIQAKIAGGTANAALSANADVLATYKALPAEPIRVTCTYNTNPSDRSDSSFYIKGLNQYDKGPPIGQLTGLDLYVGNVGAYSATPVVSDSTTSVRYFTDEGGDNLSRQVYSDKACPLALQITYLDPIESTCVDGTPKLAYVVRMEGTYTCSHMTTTGGKVVSAADGAFYCEVSHVDACIGGGGGGGGGQPPEPR